VDLSEEFIEEAKAASQSLAATFIQTEMCSLPWVSQFDGAFCFGNSMGYFDPGSTREFLAAVARTLKPNARFILDTGMAAESILPGLQPRRWFKVGDMYMLSENQYHAREGRLDIQYTFIRDGITVTRPTSSYVLTANEICRMHEEAGLKPLDLLASTAGEPYDRGSPRLILVSEKQ
jgi:SAM-dependent methyltransferase